MLVVIHGEGQVEGTAQQQRLLGEALGHAPAQGIVPTFELTTVEISSTRYDAKLEMFLLQHPRWLDQLRVPGNENWHRIAGAEWLQLLQEQPEVVRDIVERDLGVVVEDGDEVLWRQPYTGESIEPQPKLGNLLHLKRT